MNPTGLFTVYNVAEVCQENARTKTLFFATPLEGAQPGQYVMAWLPGVGEKPFSISNADPLALTVADVGPISHALNQLGRSDQVWIRGPLGHGFELIDRFHLLVGGGYGAAPLHFLARTALQQGHKVGICLGAKTKEDLIMVEAFEQMGCPVYLATEDGSVGVKGLVTAALETAFWELQPRVLYACGPTGMLMAVAKYSRRRFVPAELSFEALIRCGVGLCGSCELPEDLCQMLGLPGGFLVCHNGPVCILG